MRRGIVHLVGVAAAILMLIMLGLWAHSISGAAWAMYAYTADDGTVIVYFASSARHQIMVGRRITDNDPNNWGTQPPPDGFSAGQVLDYENSTAADGYSRVMFAGRPSLTQFFHYDGPIDRLVSMPLWTPALAAAVVAAAVFFYHRRQRRRQTAGCCVQCGYDLRATPGRCPECGTITTEMAG